MAAVDFVVWVCMFSGLSGVFGSRIGKCWLQRVVGGIWYTLYRVSVFFLPFLLDECCSCLGVPFGLLSE